MSNESAIDAYVSLIERRLRPAQAQAAETALPIEQEAGPANQYYPSIQGIDTRLERAEALAAVSGRFQPDNLLGLIPGLTGDQAAQQSVLSRLKEFCIVETAGDKLWWLMLPARRTSILSRLNKSGALKPMLASPLPATDALGEMLRALLTKGAGMTYRKLRRPQLLVLQSVLEATAGIDLPGPSPEEIRQLLANQAQYDDYAGLLTHGFIGREDELAKLHEFVKGESKPAMWTGLALSGLGGSGKTTLLGRFIQAVAAEDAATVVILDFDRPGIDVTDTYWLESEIIRQIGRQRPDIQEELRGIRRAARQQKIENAEQAYSTSLESDSDKRTQRDTLRETSYHMLRVGAESRPILLVLDTFEEVMQRDLTLRTYSWLEEIADRLAPVPLKVVISGRIFSGNSDEQAWPSEFLSPSFAERMSLGELSDDEARQLLEVLGVSEQIAARLLDVLPRRPLELKLLAQAVLDAPTASIDELEAEIREGGPAAKELVAGIIYRRVLRRIRDPLAVALAYPGLVLRYVTVELIQKVLAPVIELPPSDDGEEVYEISATDAEQALTVLATHSWLAYRASTGEIWHRRDLRRSMLKLMVGAERERAEQISRRAIDFFLPREGERDQAEAIYHDLLLSDTPAKAAGYELAQLKSISQYIVSDIGDLPPPSAVLLRFAIDGHCPADQVRLLPPRYFGTAYRSAGMKLVAGKEFGRALCLWERRKQVEDEDPLAIMQMQGIDAWEEETFFATARWDLLPPPGMLLDPAPKLSLFDIARKLYPEVLVGRTNFLQDGVAGLLKEALADRRRLTKELKHAQAGTMLTQLTTSLLMITADQFPIGEDLVEAIRQLIDKATEGRALSAILERRWCFLRQAAKPASVFELHLAPTTLRLHPSWLGFLKSKTEAAGEQELMKLVTQVEERLSRGPRRQELTARNLLGAVDALYKNRSRWQKSALPVNLANLPVQDFIDLVRGPDPEFRDPCRFALLEICREPFGRRRLAVVIASLIDLPLDDLSPERFDLAVSRDPEHALEPYIELMDRTWMLGPLMRTLNSEFPSKTLVSVRQGYDRWDEALHRHLGVIHAAANGPQPGRRPN